MRSPVTILRKAEPTPERQALAAAIAERDEHRAYAASSQAALAVAEQAARDARDEHVAAEVAVEVAKKAAPQHLIALASGKAGAAPQTIRQAKDKLDDASDHLAASREAVSALRAQVPAHINITSDRVREAAARVLATSAGVLRLAAEVVALQRELADKGQALAFLAEAGATPFQARRVSGQGVPTECSAEETAFRRLDQPPRDWRDLLRDVPGAGPWQQALEALTRDANAALPD